MDADGTNQARLTCDAADDVNPAWSPGIVPDVLEPPLCTLPPPTLRRRGAGKSNDEVTVKNALSAYSTEHPQGRTATFDGCLPAPSGNAGLKALTLTCDAPSGVALTGTGSATQGFFVSEAAVAVDIDGDGDTDSSELVAPIIWGQSFTGDDGTVRTYNIDFIDVPKHAFDLIGTLDGWKTTTADRPEDGLTLIAPFC